MLIKRKIDNPSQSCTKLPTVLTLLGIKLLSPTSPKLNYTKSCARASLQSLALS